jgi:P4 family phage/plasmid primase-like protien
VLAKKKCSPGGSNGGAKDQADVEKLVARRHDGNDYCVRSSDYAGIAKYALSLATDVKFFANAPVGLACPGGFYRIVGNEVVVEPLTPQHRQRVQLDIFPKQQPTPKFDAFLHETFRSDIAGEEKQQVALLQEIAGAVMTGVAYRYQKAILLYDPIGRAGKGTFMQILGRLVPIEFTCSVSPFSWEQEYYLINMAGKRLNVVGELPDDKPIPAAQFKSVIGGDLLSGRHPCARPVSFTNTATHVFMSNHLITSRDNTEAFFARWILVEFQNSRLLNGLPQDPLLATRIIEHELPGIAHWAFEGALRLLARGSFPESQTHTRLMEKWRLGNSSLLEFIQEDCDLGADKKVKRATFYKAYVQWCKDNGRKPLAKGSVHTFLTGSLKLGIQHAKLNGYDMLRGVDLKADTFVPERFNDGFKYQPGL